MRRPLIAVVLLFVVGILLAGLPVPLPSLFFASSISGLLFIFWPSARNILLGCLIILSGWISLAERTAIISPNDLRLVANGSEQLVQVRGTLHETPYHRVHRIAGEDVSSSMARIDGHSIRIESGLWRPIDGEIISSTKEFLPDKFFAGQTITVTGILHKPRGPVAEGLFDYRAYLANQGIYHQLDVKKVVDWQITASADKPPLTDRFNAWGRKVLAMGLPTEDESLRLEWALTLGWKTALTDEVSEPFIHASTYHVFAVDGLRIAIITGIVFGLLRVFRVPRVWTATIIIPLIFFYAAMTGWPASAIRAIAMILVVIGGWILMRPSDLINSLFAAALIILVWEPRQLFQAGFQLSFFVVLCIVLIEPFFKLVGERVLKADPMLPQSLEPRWKTWLRTPLRWVIDLFLSSIAAWLGSIPLTAYYFHILTPWSGFSNLFAIPLCALVLICNLASLLFAAWLPFVSVIFNHAGWFIMEGLRDSSIWSSHWPGAFFNVPMPGLFGISVYYLILITVLTGWMFKSPFRVWKMGGASILCVIWLGIWFMDRPVTRVTVLPLSGGHAIYVAVGDNFNDWLINCGNDSSVGSVTKPFLEAHGVNRLNSFLLTHGEISYSGGAESILDFFPPKNIYLSPVRFRSPTYRAFEDLIRNRPSFKPAIQAGSQISPWTVVYPPSQTNFAKADESRLMLLGNLRGCRVLLLSNLGHSGQSALLNLKADLHADVVIGGIPNEGEPLSENLLDEITPQAIVIADSSFPASKRASAQLRERLALKNIPVYYTSDLNAITLTIHQSDWRLEGMNQPDQKLISTADP